QNHEVTFLGDFHTYPQSQRTALRLLRDLIGSTSRSTSHSSSRSSSRSSRPSRRARPSQKKIIWKIGLEMIPTKYQNALDDFQAGRIDVRRFHERIHYQEEWGFPWQNYAPLFEWARENDIPLIALNRPKDLFTGSATLRRAGRRGELHERDQWAAGVITDQFHDHAENPRNRNTTLKMLVLYGELHLARNHLPRELEQVSKAFLGKELRNVCIYQNVDELYWKLARERVEHLVPVLRLTSGDYSVVSGTPWGKLQSLIGWAEGEAPAPAGTAADGGEDTGEDANEDSRSDPHLEFLSAMNRYGDLICHFFGLETVSFGSLNVRQIADGDFRFLSDLQDTSPLRRRLFQKLVHSNQTVCIPEIHTLFVPNLSENHAAELAAVHIFNQIHPPDLQETSIRTLYEHWMLDSAFGFFGSLLINPKRKCDFKVDHEKRIRELKRSPRKQAFPEELLARKLTVRNLRRGPALFDRKPHRSVSRSAAWISARAVGQILAKQLYHEFLNGSLTARQIREFFMQADRYEIRFKPEVISLSKTDLL
ncbi:MAG: ChaN family lipoprotein, partial [Methylotenera sp.]|nr:ChaN family lipoprotein [Oligoflexia bacterium]